MKSLNQPALIPALISSLILVCVAQAQTFTVLNNFTGKANGGNPYAGLFRDKTGNLYGTTYYYGAYGFGNVFKLDTSGTETVLYSFTGGTDGGNPYAGLVRDKTGNLYGTTEDGGDLSCNSGSGCGTVFKIDTSGTETVLHSFAGGTTDGRNPYGGLLRGSARGNLYGTTLGDGSGGYGTVFKVSKTGKETVRYNFNGADGAYPNAGLIRDGKGNLYGTTLDGGASGYGTVFKIDTSGTETVLHNFTGGTTDGCYPDATPALDKKDNLYGTTVECGSSNVGTIWKVNKKGSETVLHNFASGSSDGARPYAGVIMDAKGNLYGVTTEGGGAFDDGVVYELNTRGVLTVLHSFAGSDGESPVGGLIFDAAGSIYGTTLSGGSGGYGTVWQITK